MAQKYDYSERPLAVVWEHRDGSGFTVSTFWKLATAEAAIEREARQYPGIVSRIVSTHALREWLAANEATERVS